MTKSEIRALEKVFAAEVEDRLPFQSKAKIYQQLADKGFLLSMQRTFNGGFGVTVTGWQLSEAGRIAYCKWASEQPDEGEE